MDASNPSADTQIAYQSTGNSSSKKPSKFRRVWRIIWIILLLFLIFYVYWFYFHKYSDGERTGVLVKISRKGNIFKTDEGEMWLSCRQMTNPEKFYFSITSDSVAKQMKNLQDACVQVSYVQYLKALPWRGDSKYIVVGVKAVR